MKNAKTNLLRFLQKAFVQALEKNNKPTNSEKIDSSRRKFISQSSLAIAALAANKAIANSKYIKPFAAKEQPFKIGILGAGVAGLHAAYILQKANIETHIYEASGRTGGRMYTAKNMLGKGITTELGGEFVDSNHEDILNLAKEFNLEMVDTEDDKNLIKQIFYFDGKKYTATDLANALMPYANSIKADIDSLPESSITYHDYGDGEKFDKMSIAAYLQSKGIKGWLSKMLNVAFITEYGLESDEQSAINFLWLFKPDTVEKDLFGDSDERYKIKGGNQRVVDELAKRLKNINTNAAVTKISSKGTGFTVTFNTGNNIDFDYLICSIPFSVLRNVTLEIENMGDIKKKSINELGYGQNAKMFAGFKTPYWRKFGASGQIFSDMPLQLGWDSSQLQKSKNGGYTFYTGGKMSDKMIDTTVPEKTKEYIAQLEKVFPGAAKYYNGKNAIFYWPKHVHTLGSYACYKTGQWTTIAGAEIEPVGNLLFAGEHCSADFQGYMNGGAETGRRAAEQLLKMIKK
ncbi:MAG TPA: FAD-dependent oxidoreductase [Ferruginibacter sp.]|nr:FAD-dependent oxidoreductase [Ferruginibacter sp.]